MISTFGVSIYWYTWYICHLYICRNIHALINDSPHHFLSQAKALLTDDYGKDLATVETLIRRHDELERDLTAIENKLEVCVCVCVCDIV